RKKSRPPRQRGQQHKGIRKPLFPLFLHFREDTPAAGKDKAQREFRRGAAVPAAAGSAAEVTSQSDSNRPSCCSLRPGLPRSDGNSLFPSFPSVKSASFRMQLFEVIYEDTGLLVINK